MAKIHKFDGFVNEAKIDTALLQEIKQDFTRFMHWDEISISGNAVEAEIRDLGHWVHDEENAYYREEDGDDDWREDDDQEIWAKGEYKKYMDKFKDWVKGHKWEKKVNLGLSTGEKNWVYFTITLK